MTSVVVMTMTIIAISTIPIDATSMKGFYRDMNFIFPADYPICPSIKTADVDVIFNGSDSSTVKSCASFNFRPRDETVLKSFSLKFGRLNSGGLSSCAAGDDTGIENLMFPCLLPESVDSSNGNLIYGWTKKMGRQEIRCAMYNMVNSTKYLMVVGSNKSCDGLPQMLSNVQADMVKGFLPMSESKIKLRRTRSTSDSKNSIKNFSGSRFFWRTG